MSAAVDCLVPEIGNSRRYRVWLAAERKCHWCSCETLLVCPTGSANLATIDHIVPRYKGGSNAEDNVVNSCNLCNNRRNHEDQHGLAEGELLGKYKNTWRPYVPNGTTILATAPRLPKYQKYQSGWTDKEQAFRMTMQRDNALLEIRKLREQLAEEKKVTAGTRMLLDCAHRRIATMTFRQWFTQRYLA